MVVLHDKPGYEALVYTTDRFVAARCAEAFAALPVDWTIVDDPGKAAEFAVSGMYDFLLIDLDSPLGSTMLALAEDEKCNAVLFGITQGGVDPDLLEMSYHSLIFYPVRIEGLLSELHRAFPLAERMAAKRMARPVMAPVASTETVAEPVRETVANRSALRVPVPRGWRSLIGNALEAIKNNDLRRPSRYALSIIWQERLASMVSAFGMIWYIHEITKDWTKLAFLIPPTPGPGELIGLSVLLWLCAKHRRVAESQLEPAPVKVEDYSN